MALSVALGSTCTLTVARLLLGCCWSPTAVSLARCPAAVALRCLTVSLLSTVALLLWSSISTGSGGRWRLTVAASGRGLLLLLAVATHLLLPGWRRRLVVALLLLWLLTLLLLSVCIRSGSTACSWRSSRLLAALCSLTLTILTLIVVVLTISLLLLLLLTVLALPCISILTATITIVIPLLCPSGCSSTACTIIIL